MLARSGRRRIATLCIAVALSACRGHDASAPGRTPVLRRDLALTDEQAAYLAELSAAADASPADAAALRASGMAHMRFTLSGVVSLRDRAERDLEAALRLAPDDRELARALGRFYNFRAVERDATKARAQVEVYHGYLGERPVSEQDSAAFVAWSFSQLGAILALRDQGRLLAAFGQIRALEDALRERTAADPDDVELWAVAGNFAFFFAGNIPTGKRERVREAVRYFTHLRARWSELREGARDPDQCPNTYENFMFELAEGHTALGQTEPAADIYRELTVVRGPSTRPKQQIAHVAAERLRNLDAYAGKLELMPPWPSDIGNCIVCHSYTSDVPLTTLYSLTPISLDDIPQTAVAKPVPRTREVPPEITAIVQAHCQRCHGRGGEAESYASFVHDGDLVERSRSIERRIAAGEMPPDAALPPEARAAILAWLRSD